MILLVILALIAYVIVAVALPLDLHVEIAVSLGLVLWSLLTMRSKSAIRITWLLAFFAYARYFVFRITHTIYYNNAGDLFAVILMLIADTSCLLMVASNIFVHWYREPDDELGFEPKEVPPLTDQPTVDVFITTVNEPIEVLRRTIYGALSIAYENKKVYVLDDGRRDQVKELAEACGVGYITRQDRANFKAGNLNNAMTHTTGEFILQLDADNLPADTILDLALPRLRADESIWCLQFAIHFFTPGLLERTIHYSGLTTEMSFFYVVFLPSLARWDTAVWNGSGAVLRRSALEKIGGVAMGTILEDHHTSVKMLAQKMRVAYIPKIQVLALSPESLRSYLNQQTRWFLGTIQVWGHQKVLSLPGLTFTQRFCSFIHYFYYWFWVARLIYLFIPVLCVVFHAFPSRMFPYEFVTFWLPIFYIVQIRMPFLMYRGRSSIIFDVYEIIKAPVFCFAAIKGLFSGFKVQFVATHEATKKTTKSDAWFALIYLALLIPLVFVGVVTSAWFVAHPDWSLFWIMYTWYNIFLLLAAICVSCDAHCPPSIYAVDSDIPVTISLGDNSIEGRLVRVSDSGGAILMKESIAASLPHDRILEFDMLGAGLSVRQKARYLAEKERDGNYIIEVATISNPDKSSVEFSNFIKVAYSTNRAWQISPDIHCGTAIPHLARAPIYHAKRGVRNFARQLAIQWSQGTNARDTEGTPEQRETPQAKATDDQAVVLELRAETT